MKELDCVEVIVQKERYNKEGVYKGMQGVICFDECNNGFWLVNSPRYGEKDDIATISIHESDLFLLKNGMNAKINEEIYEQHQ